MPTTELTCRAVLFDCDGVLVNSEASVERAWRRWADMYGLDPVTVPRSTLGRRAQDSVADLLSPADRERGLATINALELDDAVSVSAVAGASRLIESIPDSARAIVTSGSQALALARLAAAGILPPALLITGDTVATGKPAPEGYLQAAAALGVRPGDAVVLEDSPAGIEAARAAGVCGVIGVGSTAADTGADVVVNDLSRLRWADGTLRFESH